MTDLFLPTPNSSGGAAPAIWPKWLPDGIRVYLSHTHDGQSLRALARARGLHASTVMRQVRRYEGRRDDPLMDTALSSLSRRSTGPNTATLRRASAGSGYGWPDEAELGLEARRVLRRLIEPGTVLAFSQDMEKSVILREGADGHALRVAVVSRTIAHAFCLKGWLNCRTNGRISTYEISAQGRQALRDYLFASVSGAASRTRGPSPEGPVTAPARPVACETPIAILARRRERDGTYFLSPAQVQAGERLREDYELAQLDGRRLGSLADIMTVPAPEARDGAARAFVRLRTAFDDLGPGLSEIALKVCCQLEGVETAEAQMGWAARSGKVVLRIALLRLSRHYEAVYGKSGPLIG